MVQTLRLSYTYINIKVVLYLYQLEGRGRVWGDTIPYKGSSSSPGLCCKEKVGLSSLREDHFTHERKCLIDPR